MAVDVVQKYCPYCMCPVPSGTLCPRCGNDPASYQPASYHLPPGILLNDRYRIGRVLGESFFGITYLGMDTNLERRVVVKEYFPTSLREISRTMVLVCVAADDKRLYERWRDQFFLDARFMHKLNQDVGIVQVLDYFLASNTAYVVMEFLDGVTLEKLTMQQGRIPAKDMLEMLKPILKALRFMHTAGILHRGMGPDNLMVLKNGETKLTDLGCVRHPHAQRVMDSLLKHGFAPLEEYFGRGQGPWTDIYAVCATAYYCMTGKVPPSSVERHCSGEDPLIPPTKLDAALSHSQEAALLKGLAVRAEDRWKDIESLYVALYHT